MSGISHGCTSGFIEVDWGLRSTSHPNVYAAGDIASLVDQPRPKSGVYAVREGRVLTLTENLRRAVAGEAGQATSVRNAGFLA